MAWDASGPRTLWLHHVTLDLPMIGALPGPWAVNPQGARCAVRYLHEGLESGADLTVVEAHGVFGKRTGNEVQLELVVRCQKRTKTTTGGQPHAPELPMELTIEWRGRARLASP